MEFDFKTAIDTLTKQRDDLVNNTTKKEISNINKKISIFKLAAKKCYDSINNNSTIDDINRVIEQLNYYNDLIKTHTERINELKGNKEHNTKKIKIDNDYCFCDNNKCRSIPIIFYD